MRARTFVLLLGLITAHPILASDPCGLGYDYTRPENWGNLRPEWTQCNTGSVQSPIYVNGPNDNDLPLISVSYGQGLVKINNTGHTLKVYPKFPATLTRGNFTATLEEFHFHVPVEHKTNTNQNARAELHLLYEFPNEEQAVLAVMIEEGPRNPALEVLLVDPPAACQSVEPTRSVNLAQLIPGALNRYFTYIGSLTTPPCKEGVLWFVLDDSIKASDDQIRQLSNGNNSRTLQQPWAHQVRRRQVP